MRRRKHRSVTDARGLATVELAIVVPVMLFLIFGLTELGRIFVHYTVLANAIRDATRHLAEKAIDNTTGLVNISDDLRVQTQNLAVYGNIHGFGAPLLPAYATSQVAVTDSGENNVSVSVMYPYQSMFGGSLPTFGLGSDPPDTAFDLQVRVTMRAL